MKAVVIGLGQFGYSVALTMEREGFEVMAVDGSSEITERYTSSQTLSHIVCADASNKQTLETLGIDDSFDCGIISIGRQVNANILATMYLTELKVKKVIAKAMTEEQARVLRRVGAHEVILPEKDMGEIVGVRLAHPNMQLKLSLDKNYTLETLSLPPRMEGKTIRQLNMRENYAANILGLSSGGTFTNNINPDYVLKAGDQITVVIHNDYIVKMNKNFEP